ncbi:MAG: hypothetical protein AAB906_02495 [Patescibacteria group bacterium]
MNKIDIINVYDDKKQSLVGSEYLKYINYYYEKQGLKHRTKYLKSSSDNYYILHDVTSKKIIKIKPPKYINLNEYIIYANKELDKILYNVSTLIESINNITDEDRIYFDKQKELYKQYITHIKQYNKIETDIKNEIDKLL